jgi:hypothetical protein
MDNHWKVEGDKIIYVRIVGDETEETKYTEKELKEKLNTVYANRVQYNTEESYQRVLARFTEGLRVWQEHKKK